ncbi:hypothetical protein SETIT_6G123400v2 [Setaria italica]|uniref:L-gulonolactone oxidase n=1 Tax=Setaria italica TaxID=4555 RepID=A0A368RL60_SETIT|nr:hypothetical protein SETIT_6G123400v2 [Setaria italica]
MGCKGSKLDDQEAVALCRGCTVLLTVALEPSGLAVPSERKGGGGPSTLRCRLRAVRIRAGITGRLASPRRPRAAAEEVPGGGDGGDRASGAAADVAEERREEDNGGTDDDARCSAAQQSTVALERQGHGFTNDGVSFTSYPVVGYQHRMQASSACVDSPEDGLQSACFWDPRLRGPSLYNPAFTVALSRAPSFLADVWRLRDLHPSAFCTLHGAMGVQMRYVKASSAYLGKPEDSIAVDIAYYRSRTRGVPRAHADVVDELEQMALRKYGGVPHWGKSRNFAFDGAIARYPKAGEFLEVKDRYDPDGIFSSEWSDQVLGIKGSPIVVGKGCAIEGLCVCSDDSHCAPEQGYFCRPGKVYAEARVCRFEEDNEARIDDEL